MQNPIPKPWRIMLDRERNCTTMYFQENSIFPSGRGVDFMVRGAVCWPATVGNGVDTATEGFVIVAGQELESKRVVVFEQRPFVCVDHILAPDRMIQYEGIAHRMTVWHSRYYVDTYYWHDHLDTHNRYLIQMLRSEMLNPKPWFAEVIWHDDNQAKHAIWEMVTHNRLVHWAGEAPEHGRMQPLYDALLRFRDKEEILPATKAMMTLAIGLERFPWRAET